MNKKTLLLFSAVGFLLVALLVVLLIGGAGESSEGHNSVPNTGGVNATNENDGTAEQVLGTGTDAFGQTPTFRVDFGVGSVEEWGETEETPNPLQSIKPSQNSQTSQSTNPSKESESDTKPAATTQNGGMPDVLLTYEQFIQLSEDEQDAYFLQFADPRDYAAWLRKAKKEYEDNQTSIIITGPIDLSTLPVDAG